MVKTLKPSRSVTKAEDVWRFSICSDLMNCFYFKVFIFWNQFHFFEVKLNLCFFEYTEVEEKEHQNGLVLIQLCHCLICQMRDDGKLVAGRRPE